MIEDFELALAKERACELAPTLAAIADVKPPKHLRMLRGTVTASYDDGFELAVELQLEPHDHPDSQVEPWNAFAWAVIALALYATIYLAVDWLSAGNPIAKAKQFMKVYDNED